LCKNQNLSLAILGQIGGARVLPQQHLMPLPHLSRVLSDWKNRRKIQMIEDMSVRAMPCIFPFDCLSKPHYLLKHFAGIGFGVVLIYKNEE
jgi:hypothetical protein